MPRDEFNDLAAFVEVARAAGFARAAARLGMSASALSHAMRKLEGRLGVRLLERTTRSVATTEAGERLFQALDPAFDGIRASLADLGERGGRVAGRLRINAPRHAAQYVLWPLLPAFLAAHPDIRLELCCEDAPIDIVNGRFDAGVRLGPDVPADMVAVPIGPHVRPTVVASPEYLARHPAPQNPADLGRHRCIAHRFASGRVWAWEFVDAAGREVAVPVDGHLIVNDASVALAAARAGLGLAHLPGDMTADDLASGRLVGLLDGFLAPWDGYCFYHTSRRHKPPPLAALVAALQAQVLPERRRPAPGFPPRSQAVE